MEFNWTDIIDRSGTNAVAIDVKPIEQECKDCFEPISFWIADMNFATAPSITEAIKKRSDHPLYGYFVLPDEYFQSIIEWQKRENGVEGLEAKHIGYENGVLGGVVTALNVLGSKGDNVLVHSPSYNGFIKVLKNNGYNMVFSDLYLDDEGVWRMDYEDMDRKIKENNIHVAVFCSPHNPTGRVWEKEEIEKAYEVFKANDVYVISDEIWSDIILYDNKHIPCQSINDDARQRTIALYSPSKTFNLGGLAGSYHIIYNKYLKDRVEKEGSLSSYNSANVLSVAALLGGYSDEGARWAKELNQVLGENIDYAYNYIKDKFEGVDVSKAEGTYLLYLDMTRWLEKNNKTIEELLKRGVEYGVIWHDGKVFNGVNTTRLNFALPKAKVEEAFERLDKYVFNCNW